MTRRMLTIEMAEDYTGYSRDMLRNAVKRGELDAERPGRSPRSRLYFDVDDLDEWMADGRVDVDA